MRELVLMTLLLAAGTASAAGQRTVSVGPAPAWVTPHVVDDAWRADAGQSSSGIDYLLFDRQWRVDGAVSEHVTHTAVVITSARGLAEQSRVEFTWNPAFQSIRVHRLEVRRQGKVFDKLPEARFEVTRRETDLDSELVDGALTAFTHLADLRIGDIVDVAFTRSGSNPVFGGKEAATFDIEWSTPVHEARVRVLWPEQRPLFWRHQGVVPEPVEQRVGRQRELVWTKKDSAVVVDEDLLPADVMPWASIGLSEDETWSDVVDWAVGLHAQAPSKTPPEMAALLAQWATVGDKRAQVLAVLQFAQEEIRYVGIEMGEQSHRPRPPAQVLQRRYGDCKDKSLFVVTALQALGIDAATALINTNLGVGLDEIQPSRRAFNHVIVTVTVGGETLWLDPTLDRQSSLRPLRYRRGLIVRPGQTTLSELPLAVRDAPTESTVERWTLHSTSRDGELVVETTSTGPAADTVRHSLAANSRQETLERFLNFYASDFPDISSAGPLEVVDDVEANAVRITERYRVANAWTTEGLKQNIRFDSGSIRQWLTKPRVRLRRFPLATVHPIHVAHKVVVDSDDGWSLSPEVTDIKSTAFAVHHEVRVAGPKLIIDMTFRSLADRVPASSIAAHVVDVDRAIDLLDFPITRAGPGADPTTAPVNHGVALAAALMSVLTAIVMGKVWRHRQTGPLPVVPASAPVGRRGLLMLVGFGVVLTPVRLVVDLWLERDAYTLDSMYGLANGADVPPGLAPLVLTMLMMEIVQIGFSLVVLGAFMARRREFRVWFIALMVLSMLGRLAEAAADAVVNDTSMATTPGAWTISLLWCGYVAYSKRSRATFVR